VRRAHLAHLLLAVGVLCALFAVLAIFDQAWEYTYGWLGLALGIQAIDPATLGGQGRLSAERTEDTGAAAIVAFLNSVFVPVLAMLHAGFLDGWGGILVACVVLLAALYRAAFYEPSGLSVPYFLGMPAIWSVLGFYLHAFDATPLVAVLLIGLCIVMGLLHYRWPNPIRSPRWTTATRTITGVWALTAAITLWNGLPASATAKGVFLAAALYGAALTVLVARETS
jgi:phosphatidylcholine synthase